jgi:hypothetical protein
MLQDNITKWIDHSKGPVRESGEPVEPGVDSSPQHFAHVAIAPKNNGQFDLVWTCENGQRGSGHDARYTVRFMHGTEILAAPQYECHLGRSEVQFKQRRDSSAHFIIDLSRVIDRVDRIQMHAEPATPVARPYERCPPGTVRPGPVWGPVCS